MPNCQAEGWVQLNCHLRSWRVFVQGLANTHLFPSFGWVKDFVAEETRREALPNNGRVVFEASDFLLGAHTRMFYVTAGAPTTTNTMFTCASEHGIGSYLGTDSKPLRPEMILNPEHTCKPEANGAGGRKPVKYEASSLLDSLLRFHAPLLLELRGATETMSRVRAPKPGPAQSFQNLLLRESASSRIQNPYVIQGSVLK